MSENRTGAGITVPQAAIIVGIVLLLVCLTTPFYCAAKITWVVQLLTRGWGGMLLILGGLGIWQERLRRRMLVEGEG